jgi:phosphoribosylformylglycinamidine synthase
MPFGGKYQLTPTPFMAAKIPVLQGETNTASVMAYGYNPYVSEQSPFHGAVAAVVESITKLVAAGLNYQNLWLTLQEYFERTNNEPTRWGKPFAALLGANGAWPCRYRR